MSNYKGHLGGGLVSFALLITAFSLFHIRIPVPHLFLLGICLFGSLFPDIDTKSKIQIHGSRVVFLVFGALILLKKWYLASILGFLLCIPLIVHHRTLTHKTWFIVLVPSICYMLALLYRPLWAISVVWYGIFFVAGAFSHLVLDYGFKKALKR